MSTPEQLAVSNNLPSYFQAEQAGTFPSTELDLGVVGNIVDAFYIQDSPSGATDTIYIVGMGDGSLRPILNTVDARSDADIKDQINAIQVSQRGSFRGIAAANVSLLNVTHVGPGPQTHGFNDPIELHGTIFGDVQTDTYAGAEAKRINTFGSLTVGRLDILRAYWLGVTHAFKSMGNSDYDACMIPLHLPAGPEASVRQGKDIVLAYPTFVPRAAEQGDNSYLTLTMVYDLLNQLQEDMRQVGHPGKLASMIVPAPSRDRLISDLQLDGYRIEGNQAVKTSPGSPNANKGLLERLRQVTGNWSAERIDLPRDATHQDYVSIIERTLAEIATPIDVAMADALEKHITGNMVAIKQRPIAPPKVVYAPHAAPAQSVMRPQAKPHDSPKPRPQPQHTNTDNDWMNDFLTTPVVQHQAHELDEAEVWQVDFTAQASIGRTALQPNTPTPEIPEEDWARDFDTPFEQPQRPDLTPQPVAPARLQPVKPSKEWSSDFAAPSVPASRQKDDDYSSDFE